MKKFDISNIIVSKIHDVYSYTLPEDEEGTAITSRSVLIIKRAGSSEYKIGNKKYVANSNNVLFIPAGTEYYMYIYNYIFYYIFYYILQVKGRVER